MLEKVKRALRLDDDELDDEVLDLIEACKADLMLCGVINISDDDPLIIQAIKTYGRANFDVTNPDHEKYIRSYESLKSHLSLSDEYTVVNTK